MSRPLPWLALVVSALALTGCGSSGAGQGSTATGNATPTSPMALAQAIVLRNGDAPGFKIGSTTPVGSGFASSPLASGACAVQTTGALAQASSPTFLNRASAPLRGAVEPVQSSHLPAPRHGGPLYTLGSLVLVDSEATEAETQLFAAIGAGAKACLHSSRKAIGGGSSPPLVTVYTISKPIPGLPIYGLRRTSCRGSFKACAVTNSEDRYFFAVGRVFVGVLATSGSGAFPASLAQRLLELLYRRALAHTP